MKMSIKKVTIVFVILFFNGLYSQTKTKPSSKEPTIKETQDWIKSVIETYGYGKISFIGSDIIYNIPSYPQTYTLYKQKVSIKDLASAKKSTSSPIENIVWLHLTCLNKNCVDVDINGNEYDFKTNILQITLNSSISEDLKDRLVKALNHLIKLYSNNKIGNTF